jgi:mono/diheme cytochrome c family protein
MHRRPSPLIPAFLLALALGACGGGKTESQPPAGGGAAAEGQLSAFEMENGIGPITQPVTVGPVDHELAEEGEKLFNTKCSACHKMAERYVGPALGDVTTRRTPAYIMNMILDPDGMTARHPVARQLLAEHMTQMPNLQLSTDEARQLLEYLRTQAHGS